MRNATRVDLDELERQLEDRRGVSGTDVLDAIAELRAAREVVQAALDWWDADEGEDTLRAETDIGRALDNYGRVVGS